MILSIFSYVCRPSGCLLWKNVYSVFLPIFSLFDFQVLSFISSLYILDTNLLSNMSFATTFPHSIGCLLIFLIVFFTVQKNYFDETPMVYFCFVSLASGDLTKKKLQWLMSKKLIPVFFSRILMISCLTFRSLIHFEFIFVYSVRKWSSFILLHVVVKFS